MYKCTSVVTGESNMSRDQGPAWLRHVQGNAVATRIWHARVVMCIPTYIIVSYIHAEYMRQKTVFYRDENCASLCCNLLLFENFAKAVVSCSPTRIDLGSSMVCCIRTE